MPGWMEKSLSQVPKGLTYRAPLWSIDKALSGQSIDPHDGNVLIINDSSLLRLKGKFQKIYWPIVIVGGLTAWGELHRLREGI